MEMGQEHDFAVYGVPPLKNRRLKSSAAPSFVRPFPCGNFTKAATLLGRDYSVFGTVIEGRKLGRQLGFPHGECRCRKRTTPAARRLCRRRRASTIGLAACRRQSRPPAHLSLKIAEPSLEVHLLDWSGDLYGKDLEVRFTKASCALR
jgi:riboflavin kinase/FMN adenylyltransferase